MDYRTLTPTYTLTALLEGFREVNLKLQRLRDSVGMPDSDGRQVALFGMQSAILGLGLTLHAITGDGLRSRARTKEEVEESLTNYATITGKTQDQLLTITETMWRHSLLTLFHFKLDVLFQNLLRGLGWSREKLVSAETALTSLVGSRSPNPIARRMFSMPLPLFETPCTTMEFIGEQTGGRSRYTD